jgi:hypothetical protein
MHLVEQTAAELREANGRGDEPVVSDAAVAADESLHRLTSAAKLVGADPDEVRTVSSVNIRAGAALLAQKARTLNSGSLPTALSGWHPAVAWYIGSPQASGANAFADDVFESLRSGVARTTNRQAIPSCSPAPCKDLPEQASNFLYLRTEPSADAPLISDAALQPGGQPGTRNAEDWGNKAVAGRRYVVAETRGDWVALWYSGQKAWLADPTHRLVGHSCETAVTLTPAPGLESIPVYGRAFPEADEYPAEVPAQVGIPLQYRIPAGQTYVAGEHIFGSRYYARFDEANVPLNHTLIKGKQEYVRVSLNHRWGWVKASDVTLNP